MKKTLLIVLAAMALLILTSAGTAASADDVGYRLDLPDEISVGLRESIWAPYEVPEGRPGMRVTCSESGRNRGRISVKLSENRSLSRICFIHGGIR